MLKDKSIFEFDNKEYHVRDIVDALRKIGIHSGDSVFVHSDLKSFGKINNKVTRDEFIGSFIESLKEVVGKDGNIIMPTFSYSFCKNEIFDPETTPSTVGVLTEYFRRLEGIKRSREGIFSVAALGPDSEYFTDVGTDCFGKKSIFEKLYDKDVKIVFLGNTFDITYMHFIEQRFGIPYRFIKEFIGKIKIGNELKDSVLYYNVRPLDVNIRYKLEEISNFLESKQVLNNIKLGNSKIRMVKAVDAFNEITKCLKNDIYFLLEEEPSKINKIGNEMYEFAKSLFPICRSITGNGVRKTLKSIQEYIPIKISEVPSGTKVFDWTIPNEWNIKDAYVMDDKGKKVIDFNENNLHLVGYSTPINKLMDLKELQEHLHSIEDMPEAIPYVTSYYKENWGFCISHKNRLKLKEGKYKVVIDSELKKGFLTYGEIIIPGKKKKEVLLSTYICHPSMANNELSGPVIATFLTKWILSEPRKYTYRIVFIPEIIGSLAYLSKNIEQMKKETIAGFVLTCLGDDRTYSYLPSRKGNTLADKVALNILRFKYPKFESWSYLDRGSDERNYCSPGIDLPVCLIMRSRFATYKEYHTSLDNMDLISPASLKDSLDLMKECIKIIEHNEIYKIKCLGEPQLGRRGLYPSTSTRDSYYAVPKTKYTNDFIAYADGTNDLIDISNIINAPVWDLYPIVQELLKADLIEECKKND